MPAKGLWCWCCRRVRVSRVALVLEGNAGLELICKVASLLLSRLGVDLPRKHTGQLVPEALRCFRHAAAEYEVPSARASLQQYGARSSLGPAQ